MKINPLALKSLAIIGVPVLAAAILFPVFANARENARRSSCQSNLKQIGLSFAQYAQDYDGHLPPVKFTTFVAAKNNRSASTGSYGWADGLQPYLKSICTLYCPSGRTAPGLGPNKRAYTNYWMNARLDGAKRSGSMAQIILIGDGVAADTRSTARYSLSVPPDQNQVCSGYDGACESAWKHLGGANFGFLDGHVKWLMPDQVSARTGDPATFAP
ncbi:hypothetical protein IAD21_04960 [Abditibacteriota bacterium]|nr:hypothetical protein IAD21_04960 [Abditibacteriota bacterium]